MKFPIAWSALLALAGLSASEARAVGRLADVVVVDRESGAELAVHRHRGEWWIEGRPGARYAIRIRNAGAGRLLAVTSVDGVNVVTGETAAVDQRGYVYDPWRSYDITGWRKSDAQVAAFEFTSVPRSYAARTGRPDDVGVIGVALFRERVSVRDAAAETDAARLEKSSASARATAPLPAAAQALGTGHGNREASAVTRVDFERAHPRPDEVIQLRYDSRANLVARGVLPSPAPGPHRPEAFPSGPRLGYVPDP